MGPKLVIQNALICNPDKSFEGSIIIEGAKFSEVKSSSAARASDIDLSGYTAYPGLINSHDHLLGNYLPKVGRGPYLNWKPWDEDLKEADLYKERGKIPTPDIYLLSYYRQILSGVTTVSDHIPHKINKALIPHALVRIIKDYCLAHEASSYDLKWGDGIEKEASRARKFDIPFITHIEEGWDEEAMAGIPNLIKLKGLFKRTVLIHCIACNASDIRLIARNKANMVWCPSSNVYMFGMTANVRTFLKEGVNVALGTDSPMSGGLNLLEEMKFARKQFRKMYKKELGAKDLFRMVTLNAAKAFNLDARLGSIEKGKAADLLVMKNRGKDPYERIASSSMDDVELVMRDGRLLLVSEKLSSAFPRELAAMQKVRVNGKKSVYLAGRPLDLKKRINSQVGFDKILEFFPVSA